MRIKKQRPFEIYSYVKIDYMYGAAIRKEAITSVGMIDEDLIHAESKNLKLKIIKHYPRNDYVYLGVPGYIWRLHGRNKHLTKNNIDNNYVD